MKNRFAILPLLLLAVFLPTACMDYGENETERIAIDDAPGLFIINEGNFMYGTGSLSYYDIRSKQVENNVFLRTNGVKLGDVAQSMTIHKGLGYIVVNNSSVIFVIDIRTFELVKILKGFISPRYVHFVNDEKAYVTDLYTFAITVFNPQTLEITNRIKTDIKGKTAPSTEQMVQYKNYVFTNCWSYDNKILVIDTDTDTAIDYIEVGKQPTSLVLDKNNKLWTITDGGYAGSPYGQEAPGLYKVDAETRSVEQVFRFETGDRGSEICMNEARDSIFFIRSRKEIDNGREVSRDHIWKMSVEDKALPAEPFLTNTSTNHWYGLAVDPHTSEVYVADAIDYVQPGFIYRYSAEGERIDKFQVGVIPGAFCFNY